MESDPIVKLLANQLEEIGDRVGSLVFEQLNFDNALGGRQFHAGQIGGRIALPEHQLLERLLRGD